LGAIFGVIATQKIDMPGLQQRFHDSLATRFNDFFEVSHSEGIMLGGGGWSDKNFYLFDCPQKYTVVAEGEIYNTRELMDRFFSDQKHLYDQECFAIIPFLYEKFGLDFPKYLNGVFAIALWDDSNQVLHLCRDHVGSHTLFYALTSKGLFFSSTINSLLSTGLVPAQLSPAAINQYFSSKALSPPSCMFSGVSSVRASHVVSIKQNNVSEYDYWNLHKVDVDKTLFEDEIVDQLREIILDAITIRGQYSSSYGSIVSGGLDTGIVTAILAQKNAKKNLNSFSVSFEEEAFSDAPRQKMMVDRYRLHHHHAVLGPDEFVRILKESVCYLDAPVNDIAFVGMAKVFSLAKEKGVDVVFEGEGPDEIFPAGNSHGERQISKFLIIPKIIRQGIMGNFLRTMPLGDSVHSKMLRFLVRIAMDDSERQLTWRTYFHNALRKKLLDGQWYDPSDPYENQKQYLIKCMNTDEINRYQYGLIKTFLADDLLYKDERMAASRGVLNRVPLVDYRLVELALKIPSHFQLSKPDKLNDGIKLLYKKAISEFLPQEIVTHKKERGFSHPTSIWYKTVLKKFVLDILLGDTTRKRGIFNFHFIEKLVSQHIAGKANYDYPINSLLVFELWARANYDRCQSGL